VLWAVNHLLGGKGEVQEVLSQCTGQRLFEKRQVFFCLELAHETEGGLKVRDDLFAAADKTAINLMDAAPLEGEVTANFVEFFLVHRGFSHTKDFLYCTPILKNWVARFTCGAKE